LVQTIKSGIIKTTRRPLMKKVGATIFIVIMILCIMPVSQAEDNPILKLKEKIIEIQNKGELGFRNFTACSNIISYGSYVPLPSSEIKSGSEFFVYYEPENVFTNKVQGLYEIWYGQDMIVLDGEGNILLNKENALDFHYKTKSPVLDLYAKNTLSLGNLPPGDYVFRAVIHDKLKKTRAQKDYKFKVVK
jgi:hypothetical protein